MSSDFDWPFDRYDADALRIAQEDDVLDHYAEQDRSIWDEYGYQEALEVMREAARLEAEADWADRWLTAWDRLEGIGVVGPEDHDITLSELERLTALLPEEG